MTEVQISDPATPQIGAPTVYDDLGEVGDFGDRAGARPIGTESVGTESRTATQEFRAVLHPARVRTDATWESAELL